MTFDDVPEKVDWQPLAEMCAEEAYTNHMSSHYCVFCIEDDEDTASSMRFISRRSLWLF